MWSNYVIIYKQDVLEESKWKRKLLIVFLAY